jgi:hypothetical protein
MYLGKKVANQNDTHKEIKSKSNLGNTCHHSVWNILFYGLLSENIKIKIHKTIIYLGVVSNIILLQQNNAQLYEIHSAA